MINDKVILLGNGLNRLENDISWKKILQELTDYANLSENIDIDHKSFPLLYEEIYLTAVGKTIENEDQLKKKISQLVSKFNPNNFHKQILDMGFSHILTTNYDYTLEAALPRGSKSAEISSIVKESRYSLLRTRTFNGSTLWHVHGEVNRPSTIMLGYEHYSGYLERIRGYVFRGVRYKRKKIPALLPRLRKKDFNIVSWVDLMFCNNVYILGLNLDMNELCLWWILTYRARQMVFGKKIPTNRITYIYEVEDGSPKDHVINMLRACNVSTHPIPLHNKDYHSFYRKALEFISSDSH